MEKNILLSGDFRQCLPVIQGATRAGIVRRCIKRGLLWKHFTVFHLTVNLRLSQTPNRAVQIFDKWALAIGDGKKDKIYVLKNIL